MPPTEENIKWAMEKLRVFSNLPGFPKEPIAYKAQAKALLRIVHNKPINEIVECVHPHIPDNPNDVDWLIDEALAQYDRYPLPLHLRQIYSVYLTPEDGEVALVG